MSESSTIYVGPDQHQESIAVAYVGADRSLEPIYLGSIGTRTSKIDAMVRKLQSKGKKLVFAYEAGPCGYGLHHLKPVTSLAVRLLRTMIRESLDNPESLPETLAKRVTIASRRTPGWTGTGKIFP